MLADTGRERAPALALSAACRDDRRVFFSRTIMIADLKPLDDLRLRLCRDASRLKAATQLWRNGVRARCCLAGEQAEEDHPDHRDADGPTQLVGGIEDTRG